MSEMLSKLKVGELFQKLRLGLEDLVKESKGMSDANSGISSSEIGRLRGHIVKRISRREDVKENQEILKILDLLSDDKIFIDVIKEESAEWLEFLDSIEKSVKNLDSSIATAKEKDEVDRIVGKIERVKGLIRGDQS
ncbi:MAG: hypothetical protein QXN59_00315 [Candidatus Micrarchaeaceae archaeon]